MEKTIIFRMLGFIFNDNLRLFNPVKSVVYEFYLAENTIFFATRKQILHFKKICQLLISEYSLADDLSINYEKNPKGYSENVTKVTFSSSSICSLLSEYLMGNSISSLLSFSSDNRKQAEEQKLAFIIGAYLTYDLGKDAHWYFYNDYNKAMLVHSFMTSLASEDDKFLLTSYFNIPQACIIRLNKNGSLWDKIKSNL